MRIKSSLFYFNYLKIVIVEEVKNKLWTAFDLQIPLILEDFDTYLLREGVFSEEDYKKVINARKLLKEVIDQMYNKKASNVDEVVKKRVDEVLNLISSLQPKKPLPPEMKRRIEDLKQNLEYIKEIILNKQK